MIDRDSSTPFLLLVRYWLNVAIKISTLISDDPPRLSFRFHKVPEHNFIADKKAIRTFLSLLKTWRERRWSCPLCRVSSCLVFHFLDTLTLGFCQAMISNDVSVKDETSRRTNTQSLEKCVISTKGRRDKVEDSYVSSQSHGLCSIHFLQHVPLDYHRRVCIGAEINKIEWNRVASLVIYAQIWRTEAKMVFGMLVAGAAATGLGYLAARRVNHAYRQTRAEMGMESSMQRSQYPSQGSYYSQGNGSGYHSNSRGSRPHSRGYSR